jgi:hypothetical protein
VKIAPYVIKNVQTARRALDHHDHYSDRLIGEIYGEHSVEVAVLSTTPEDQMVIQLYYELSPVILMAIQMMKSKYLR